MHSRIGGSKNSGRRFFVGRIVQVFSYHEVVKIRIALQYPPAIAHQVGNEQALRSVAFDRQLVEAARLPVYGRSFKVAVDSGLIQINRVILNVIPRETFDNP